MSYCNNECINNQCRQNLMRTGCVTNKTGSRGSQILQTLKNNAAASPMLTSSPQKSLHPDAYKCELIHHAVKTISE